MGYIGRTPTGSILTGADIADGSISTAKLADTAVSTAKIADDAVTIAKATGFGKIGQVVSNTVTTNNSTSGTTYTDTGLSATITPTSSSSKILVLPFNPLGGDIDNDSGGTIEVKQKLLRDSTTVYEDDRFLVARGGQHHSNAFSHVLDTPNTTSAITYKCQFARSDAGSTDAISNQGGREMTMTLMEILA